MGWGGAPSLPEAPAGSHGNPSFSAEMLLFQGGLCLLGEVLPVCMALVWGCLHPVHWLRAHQDLGSGGQGSISGLEAPEVSTFFWVKSQVVF